MTLNEALQRGVLDPTSGVFHDPRTQVVFSVDKAIAHALMDETGHHTHYRTKQLMTLQVLGGNLSKFIFVFSSFLCVGKI